MLATLHWNQILYAYEYTWRIYMWIWVSMQNIFSYELRIASMQDAALNVNGPVLSCINYSGTNLKSCYLCQPKQRNLYVLPKRLWWPYRDID